MIIVACLLNREPSPGRLTGAAPRLPSTRPVTSGLWYVDNALHGDDEIQEYTARRFSYLALLHEAFPSLAD